MEDAQKFSLIVLAGGKSSRMKMNKALLEIGDKRLIEVIIDSLKGAFDEVIVVTNTPQEYSFLPYKLVGDIYKDRGPLGGIHVGLKQARNKYALITACDMPFVESALAKKLCMLAVGYDVVVPKKGDYLQPLFAVYSKNCLPHIETCLKEGKNKIITFYPSVKILYADWDSLLEPGEAQKIFFNVNTPKDLDALKKFNLGEE
ncbi:MAG: molybdenum cofactor guanylyltransferase [Bacillota bacterium]